MELDRPLTPDECVEVPVGTIVEGERNAKAVRTYVGWMDNGPRTYPPRYLHQYVINHRLRVLGDQPKQTLHHFRQRLRTVAIGRARANGVDISPVHRILDGCGVPVYEPSIGMWVDTSDNELMPNLPDGTIIQAGTPDIWGLYALYVKRGNEWRWLTGGHAYTEGGTIIELPDGDVREWYSTEWVEADDQLIEDLKREVLRIGAEAKRSASWCGQYELALERLCIEVKDRDEAIEEQEEEAPFEAPPLTNQWLEPPRGAFVVGDRVTRRNRPHTTNGRGNFTEAEIGTVGTITDHVSVNRFQDRWRVRWDTNRTSIIDGQCIMLAEQEFAEGVHVARAYNQRLAFADDDTQYDHQAPQGDVGVVGSERDDDESVYVTWSNGHYNVYDKVCLEIIRPAEEGTARVMPQVGDRVRRNGRQYSIRGYAYSSQWEGIADEGAEGEVTRVNDRGVEGVISVRWDVPPRHGSQERRIDSECVEVIAADQPLNSNTRAREPQVGDQVRLISRFAYRGQSQDTWDDRFGVVGDIGVVVDNQTHDANIIRVRWPNGSDPEYRSNVDRVCVEVVTPETEEAEPEPPALAVGDRVRIPGNYWVTDPVGDARIYNHLAPEGSVGVIRELQNFRGQQCAMVRWDHQRSGTTRVNVAALEHEPERRPFQRRDRVRLARPYTIEGRTTHRTSGREFADIYPTGMFGEISRIESHNGTVGVRWEDFHPAGSDGYINSRVDAACLDLVTEDEVEDAEREWQVGDRVELIAEYTNHGEPRSGCAAVGDQGRINGVPGSPEYNVPEGMVQVAWENDYGASGRYIDIECIRLVTSETVDERPLEVGDRVRRLDNRYSISDMGSYNPRWERYCSPGDVGEVTEVGALERGIVRVRWDNDSEDENAREGRGRRIDVTCVERVR